MLYLVFEVLEGSGAVKHVGEVEAKDVREACEQSNFTYGEYLVGNPLLIPEEKARELYQQLKERFDKS